MEMRNIFIAYPEFPEFDANSGALRLCEIVRVLREGGYRVTFVAEYDNGPRYRQSLEAMDVECHVAQKKGGAWSASDWGEFLSRRSFEAAIFVHDYIYQTYAEYFRAFLPACPCILDTVDLRYVRVAREAELLGGEERMRLASAVRQGEWMALRDADAVWTVTEDERRRLHADGLPPDVATHVVPNIHRPDVDTVDFAARSGIVFIGSYAHYPNVDAVRWLLQEIAPLVASSLPDAALTLVGRGAPSDLEALAAGRAGARFTGYVADHRSLLRAHRVALAPLRYGAGMKGKIGEYLCCGLPCVSTSIGVEGMGLSHGENVLVAESPTAFADAVVALYNDEKLWTRLSGRGKDYMALNYGPEAVRGAVLEAVQCRRRRRGANPNALCRLAGTMVNPVLLPGRAKRAWQFLSEAGPGELVARGRQWLHRPR